MWEIYYYSEGLAVCEFDIINDCIYCRFRDEEFEVYDQKDQFNIIKNFGPYPVDFSKKMLFAKVSELRKYKAAKTVRK